MYNLSESVVKMSADLTRVLSYFTPSSVSALDQTDSDLGSGGVLLLRARPTNVLLATAGGKDGAMYLLNPAALGGHHNPDRVLGEYSIGGCWCGESYFTGWDGIGRVVSSGGNRIIVWRLQTSAAVTLIQESASPALPASVQDPGFFTSVSSKGTSNAIIWAVGRPVDHNPADVTLYAFAPQAAAAGNNRWLFSAVAGNWPNTTSSANIMPVVANGRVYVASYKRLAIFGLAPSAAARHAPVAPPVLPPLPPGSHEIFGTIKAVAGGNITLAGRTGKLAHVDATSAMHRHMSVVLLIGEPITVFGSYDGTGVLHAASVLHAKPSPKGWPEDR
jgi:hypothetical protein